MNDQTSTQDPSTPLPSTEEISKIQSDIWNLSSKLLDANEILLETQDPTPNPTLSVIAFLLAATRLSHTHRLDKSLVQESFNHCLQIL